MERPNSPRPIKARQVKNRVRSMLIILSNNKIIVHKVFILLGQTVNSAYYWMFYGECEEMYEDFEL
jgi:hypothetical protein